MPITHFLPTRIRSDDLFNAICYIVPKNIRAEIKDSLLGLVEYPNEKLAFNALEGLPIKNFNNGSPVFSKNYLDELKNRLPDFAIKQKRFKATTKKLIMESAR